MTNSRMNTRSASGKGHSNCIVQTSLVFHKIDTDKDVAYSLTLANPVKQIINRLKNSGEKNSANNLENLAKHPEIFSRLVKYANDSEIERHVIFRSFSKVKKDDILKMGVEIFPDIPFGPLAHTIRLSPLIEDFQFADVLDDMQLNPVSESAGEKAFKSASESNARVGIHQIMSKIIDKFQRRKVFLVEEHIIIARLKSKVAPIEVIHENDGVVNSFFLSGVLDFLCCSSNIDELSLDRHHDQAFEDWENSPAVPPDATWKDLEKFLVYLEDRARVFEKWSDETGGPQSRWQLLVIEAKSMAKRSTDKSHPKIREFAPGLELEVQKLFLLDPDQWFLAHENLNTLLPFRDNDTSVQLHHVVLDRYLSIIWHSSKNNGCQARYMPFEFLRDTGSHPDKSEIDRFREISGLPTSSECSSCPLEPVVGVIQHDGQYFVVVVPHVIRNQEEEKRIYILGNVIGQFQDYQQYRNQHLLGKSDWKHLLKIGRYHGWNMEEYEVYHTSWHENSGDSGPIACEVTRDIFKNGFSFNRDIPTCWCTHNIRLDILATLHTSAIQKLARFPEIHKNQSLTTEYSHYFGSRREQVKQRLEKFWKDVSDHNSKSGFVYISKELAKGMGTCQHCIIELARSSDEGADSGDDDPDDDAEDEIEMQEVEAYVLPDLAPSVGSLVDGIHQLDISGSRSKLSARDAQSKEHTPDVAAVNVVPQHPLKQRSLKKYVYQAIAESLAMHLAPKPDRFQENIMKFCVSSSEDWIFGVIDCTPDHRSCYITDTLTHRSSEKNSKDFHDIITLLLTWMCVPAEEILPYMKEIHTTSKS